MPNNFAWQEFQTKERIEARLREADDYRLAQQITKISRFHFSISEIARLYVSRAGSIVRSLANRVNTAPSGQADHAGKPVSR